MVPVPNIVKMTSFSVEHSFKNLDLKFVSDFSSETSLFKNLFFKIEKKFNTIIKRAISKLLSKIRIVSQWIL